MAADSVPIEVLDPRYAVQVCTHESFKGKGAPAPPAISHATLGYEELKEGEHYRCSYCGAHYVKKVVLPSAGTEKDRSRAAVLMLAYARLQNPSDSVRTIEEIEANLLRQEQEEGLTGLVAEFRSLNGLT